MNITIAQRPSISEVYDKIIEIINKQYILPKTSNKGKPGNYLEELVGIPTSSACLDCSDGEVKVFPVKKVKSGKFVPKETIAVTMINNEDIKNHSFDDSRCYKKLLNTLYVPYYREDDVITYFKPTIINLFNNDDIKKQLKQDYDAISEYLTKNNTLEGGSSILGYYLQNRTKGAGKDAPKTRAFYLRTQFISDFVNINPEKS
jgi:hypothetical protein